MIPFMRLSAWLVYLSLLMPILMVMAASFTAGGFLAFPPQGWSLRWWEAMINDRDMVHGFMISLRVALVVVALSVPLGALAAIQLSLAGPRRHQLWSGIFASPLSVPLVLTGFSLLVFFTQMGLINERGLIIGHLVVSVPYVLRSALASLSLADHSLPRAAAIHGAAPVRVIWHVYFPLIKPGLISGGLFAFLASINNIVISVFVTQPGGSPLPVVIFSRMENLAEPSVAAASTTVIICTALLCLLLERRYSLFRALASR